jgi:hypothetical protein
VATGWVPAASQSELLVLFVHRLPSISKPPGVTGEFCGSVHATAAGAALARGRGAAASRFTLLVLVGVDGLLDPVPLVLEGAGEVDGSEPLGVGDGEVDASELLGDGVGDGVGDVVVSGGVVTVSFVAHELLASHVSPLGAAAVVSVAPSCAVLETVAWNVALASEPTALSAGTAQVIVPDCRSSVSPSLTSWASVLTTVAAPSSPARSSTTVAPFGIGCPLVAVRR